MSSSPQTPQVLARRPKANESTKGHHAPRAGKDKPETDKVPNGAETPRPARTKPQSEGEKLVIRRLPPGMIEEECKNILGEEWKVGGGKVDWFDFAIGKVSTDPSKPSRPGRCYLHILKKDDIMMLNDVVRTAIWEDAKGTENSPSLVGPPIIEFSIHKKVPSSKRRPDARQGTIDQDPDFMAFLETLANPAQPKDNANLEESNETEVAGPKIFTTPLIEFLKEKKANKGKEVGSSKGSKKAREESGSRKGKGKDSEPGKKRGKEEKIDKQPKESVKILTKKAASDQAAEVTGTVAGQATAIEAPKSRRAGIAAAARILQRDLGLSPGSAHRKARQDAAKAGAEAAKVSSKDTGTLTPAVSSTTNKPTSPAPSIESAPKSTGPGVAKPSRRNRGGKSAEKGKAVEINPSMVLTAANPPMILKKKKAGEEPTAAETASPAAEQSTAVIANPTSILSSTKGGRSKSNSSHKKQISAASATRAFVKHANASQGITEPILKAALGVFGTVTFVEIDKRKGFGYVDFADHDGLVKAIRASPVNVAQGAVQIIERKDKKPVNNNNTNGSAQTGEPAINTEKMEKVEKSDKPSGGRGRRGRGKGAGLNANTSTNHDSPTGARISKSTTATTASAG